MNIYTIMGWLLTLICVFPGILLLHLLSLVRVPMTHSEATYLLASKVFWLLIVVGINFIGFSCIALAIGATIAGSFIQYNKLS